MNDTSFVLPDAECFQVLAGMAGQIQLALQGDGLIDVAQALQNISASSQITHNGFSGQNLEMASEGIAGVIFNALVIAGVCEAHAPNIFSNMMDETFQKMPLPPVE